MVPMQTPPAEPLLAPREKVSGLLHVSPSVLDTPFTLWNPPSFWKAIVSPAVTVRVDGM